MLPKNVRQVGRPEGNRKIYIEDYVMTYARKFEGMAVLLGKWEEEGEDKILYVLGAVKINHAAINYAAVITNEEWSAVYEQVRKYFMDYDIIGWMYTRSDSIVEISEEIRRIQEENFKGSDKLLFLYDRRENEEAFYLSSLMGELRKQSGYYIYFEKNKAMQDYMIDENPVNRVDEEVTDDAMEKVREIIAKKEEKKSEKKIVGIMYAASTVLAAAILVIGATMLDSYDKMQTMEEALNTISTSLSENESDRQNRVIVETVSGNTVLSEESESTESLSGEENAETGKILGKKSGTEAESLQANKEISDTETSSEKGEKPTEEKGTSKKENESETDTNSEKVNDVGDEKKSKETDKKKTEKETTVEKIEENGKEYEVQPGDTLASISLEHYQSYQYIEKIQELNEIENSDVIYEGQKLMLP